MSYVLSSLQFLENTMGFLLQGHHKRLEKRMWRGIFIEKLCTQLDGVEINQGELWQFCFKGFCLDACLKEFKWEFETVIPNVWGGGVMDC